MFKNELKIESLRGGIVKQRAISDAIAYFALMKKISPESLILEDNGNPILNAADGKEIINKARSELNLSSEEMPAYLLALVEAVKKMIS